MGIKKIKFEEGQWFAVPLEDNGFVIGLVVRGNSKGKKAPLAYFFAPEYPILPNGKDTYDKSAANAIHICWFSYLGLITGEWPLIKEGKPFIKSEWPVPLFYRKNLLKDGFAFIGEFDQDDPDSLFPIKETVIPINDSIRQYPLMGLDGIDIVKYDLEKKINKLKKNK